VALNREALIRLLSDGDPRTVELVKEQLIDCEEPVKVLRDLANCDDAVASRLMRDVLKSLQLQEDEDDFDLYCRFFCDHADLEPALWHLCRLLDPQENPQEASHQIDLWAQHLSTELRQCESSSCRIKTLSHYMTVDLGFRGNSEDYYKPGNSLLTSVIRSRQGLPITLVLLFRMIALRAGMIVDGVNLPGHFIARHEGVFFDPFHGGHELAREDCELLVARQGRTLHERHLRPANPRQILSRILANLKYAYELLGDEEHEHKVARWLAALHLSH